MRLLVLLLAPLLALPATAQRAEVLWDAYGVPHIYAEDDEALMHAFGWAQMEAHGDLLLRLAGQARGRAAEYWGEAFLEGDRQLHAFGAERMASGMLAAAPDSLRRAYDAFAAGLNAYAAAYPDRLADSLHAVLPLSTLDVMRRGVQANLQFAAGTQGALRRWAAQNGSNAWALAGPKVVGHEAILLGNPHLPWSDAFKWFEAHLVGPGFEVYGVTFVGMPVIAIGFTERHGWTHTVNTIDAEDLYEITLAEGGYLLDGAVRPFDADTLALRVRMPEGGFREEPFVVRYAEHGPVLAVRGDRALARRAALDRLTDPYGQWWAMAQAGSLEAFEGALRRNQISGFTTTYADREGHILHHGGVAPRRPQPDRARWAGVLPGETSHLIWQELHQYDEVPRVVTPPSGWVQNANEASWWATWPLALDPEAFPGTFGPREPNARTQRSITLLAESGPLAFEDVRALRLDSRFALADRLVPDLVAAARAHGSDMARRAADVLEAWDRTAEAGSRGGVLFQAWTQAMTQRFGPGAYARPWSPEHPLTTPAGLANPPAATVVLDAVARQIEAMAVPLDVPWGVAHRLRHAGQDLPASGGPGALGAFRVFHFQPGADGRAAAVHGDTFVMLVGFGGEAPRAEAVLVYGNATQAGSPHVGDQLPLAAEGRLRPVSFTRAAVEAAAQRRTVVLE